MSLNPQIRRVARLIVIDASGAVLLIRYNEHRANRSGSFWCTPGGEIEPGEQPQHAAIRELAEETGLSAELVRKLWQKTFTFELPQGFVNQHEEYFLVRIPEVNPSVQNFSAEPIREHRWWTLIELQSTSEVIYPEGLVADLEGLFGERAT
jgi:8-oxo-dGTP pyrophosphatase MutT (NUDIX family)